MKHVDYSATKEELEELFGQVAFFFLSFLMEYISDLYKNESRLLTFILLTSLHTQCGEVKEVRLGMTLKGKPRGFAYVEVNIYV